MTALQGPLAHERQALRQILDRLLEEESSLETLCKHAPRLVSVAATVARIDAGLENGKGTDDLDALKKALRELEEGSGEEETQW